MNATSAGDCGGRVARVDDGSVLLGVPGAPGCTTTGFAVSVCCARAAGEKEIAKTLAASNARTTVPPAQPGLGSRRRRTGLQLGVKGRVFIWTRTKSCHETGNFHRGKEEARAVLVQSSLKEPFAPQPTEDDTSLQLH